MAAGMAEGIPEGLAIENVWAVEATYGPDAAARRAPVRHEHLERIGRLMSQGIVLEAGGYLDMKSSLLLVRAADEESAIAILREDVYTRSGVWTGFTARALGRVIKEPQL
jgi:uncharacterized protein YciI